MRSTKLYCGRSRADGSLILLRDVLAFIQAEVATQYEAFTLTHATGYWNGKPEETFVLEFITDTTKFPIDFRPKQIAQAYKKQFNQEAVLITYQDIETVMI